LHTGEILQKKNITNDWISWTSSSFWSTLTTTPHFPILQKWISFIFNLDFGQKIAPECGSSYSSVPLKVSINMLNLFKLSIIWGWDKWLWKEWMNTIFNILCNSTAYKASYPRRWYSS
jgi:hypothetical protein